jgi:hypothetical protein
LREASSNHYRSDGDEPISGVVCWLLSGQGLVRPNGPWSAKLITRSEKSPTIGWKNANLRSEMTRLLRRTGVSGWPRLFHFVKFQEGRSSRQTELQPEFPLHMVCSWLGNSPSSKTKKRTTRKPPVSIDLKTRVNAITRLT